jgi:YfiH family protein
MITDEILAEKGFAWRMKDGVKVLVSPALEAAGFTNGFSTRPGGVSQFPENALSLAGFDDDTAENIYENRRRFLRVFAGDWQLATCWQIHSAGVRAVATDEDVKNDTEKCDGIISRMTGVLAGVKTADCVPVLIGDKKTGAFAAVHAGWRGTSNSIAKMAVERMAAEFGSRPRDLIAAIGPAALGCCYEVGDEVLSAFRENFSYAEELFTHTRAGHARIDLHRANQAQLSAAGVLPENIYPAPLCTMELDGLFFSYRVESRTRGKTGRLLSVIGRR